MRYVQLPPSLFTANREALSAQLPPGSLAILHANDVMPTNADGTMGFRQNSDLYYLSGVDQEETILILFPGARDPEMREVLFVRETSELLAVWEGAKLSKTQAQGVSGVSKVLWTSEFPRVLNALMYEAEAVYLNLNEHLRSSSEVETRERRFVREIQGGFPLHRLGRLAPLMHRLRMVKRPEELDAIRQATRTTDAGFRRVLRFVEPGVMEFEIEAELAREYLRGRSRGFAYPPIIASGANACVLHYVENNAPCQDGELLLMDVAAEYANYHSDMTRTIPVNGKFTPRQREVYDAVLRMLRWCSTALNPGVLLKDLQKQAEARMEEELIGLGLLQESERAKEGEERPAYKKYFMHGISHHIGLDVHDVFDPALPLAPNMIVTVEPGIYIREEGLAVRLENLFVIGENENADLMAGVPLEADEIEALMAKP
jgi:Xaa-Pro aminopeptidase